MAVLAGAAPIMVSRRSVFRSATVRMVGVVDDRGEREVIAVVSMVGRVSVLVIVGVVDGAIAAIFVVLVVLVCTASATVVAPEYIVYGKVMIKFSYKCGRG